MACLLGADRGVAESKFNLGLMYIYGTADKKDFDYGLSLINDAAFQGYQGALNIIECIDSKKEEDREQCVFTTISD